MYQPFEETASFFISNAFIRNTKIGRKKNSYLPSSMLSSKNRVYPIEMFKKTKCVCFNEIIWLKNE